MTVAWSLCSEALNEDGTALDTSDYRQTDGDGHETSPVWAEDTEVSHRRGGSTGGSMKHRNRGRTLRSKDAHGWSQSRDSILSFLWQRHSFSSLMSSEVS